MDEAFSKNDIDQNLRASLPPFLAYSGSRPMHLETGRKGGKPTPFFESSTSKRVFHVDAFPNPYQSFKKHKNQWLPKVAQTWTRVAGNCVSPGYAAILNWMFENMSRSQMADLNLIIEEAAGLIYTGTPVRIECVGGKHRSVAVSHAIARRCFYPIECIHHTEVLQPLAPTRQDATPGPSHLGARPANKRALEETLFPLEVHPYVAATDRRLAAKK